MIRIAKVFLLIVAVLLLLAGYTAAFFRFKQGDAFGEAVFFTGVLVLMTIAVGVGWRQDRQPSKPVVESSMSLTISAGAILGLAGSMTWLAIRLALNGVPKDFFGEGLGWAIVFVGAITAFGAGIGLGVVLAYGFYRAWMNQL
jgi:hypothetical protein